jgi:hypothetical protein
VSTLASDPGFWAWLVVLAILGAVLILLSINLSPRDPGDRRAEPATPGAGDVVAGATGPDTPPAGGPRVTFADLRLARDLVIADVLGARTLEGCDRATALLHQWLAAFEDDEEMRIYGYQVARVRSALLVAGDGPRAASGEPQPSADPGVDALDG